MKLTDTLSPALEIDASFKEHQLNNLGMKKLEIKSLQYSVYELNDIIYYFEEDTDCNFRLFCKTSKKSFYLI